MENFLNQVYFGNSLQTYLIALIIIALGIITAQVVNRIIGKKIAASLETDASPEKETKIRNIKRFLVPLIYFGALYIAVKSITLPEKVTTILNYFFIIVSSLLLIRFILALLGLFIEKYIEVSEKETDKNKIRVLMSLINVTIWVIGILFLLDNLGFNISTIIAGLGIGGIAVALAAQAILGDLFSYFVIFFDKPFQLGDFVIFDDKRGVIEKIGIKTTKIRSLSGELLVVSNSYLTGTRLHNYKQMKRRRVVFSLGVVYGTSIEQLKVIPEKIKGIIENIQKTQFDRCNFFSYGNFSLDFETVYFIEDPDYNLYAKIQEEINLKIMHEFSLLGVEFAYPTQTIYLGKADRITSDITE